MRTSVHEERGILFISGRRERASLRYKVLKGPYQAAQGALAGRDDRAMNQRIV